MKTLIRLVVLGALAAGLGYGWFRQSVHYAILEIGRAVDEGDVNALERHMDLASLSGSLGELLAQTAKAEVRGIAGDNLLGDLLGGLAGAVAGEIAEAAQPELELRLRRRLAQGEAFHSFGPFVPAPSYEAIGLVREEAPSKTIVTIVGTCFEQPASVNVVFARTPGPFGLDVLGSWRAVALEPGSVALLAASCQKKG
ncbi:MAG: DUF2939 domain-containing protein [Myxococcota bacterium]